MAALDCGAGVRFLTMILACCVFVCDLYMCVCVQCKREAVVGIGQE